jgi:hypothetical protein
MSARRLWLGVLTAFCASCAVFVFGSVVALAAAPAIEGVSFSDAGSASATLSAEVNPQGVDTTYRFEYGTSVSYGQSLPSPAGDAGAGSSLVSVQASPQGLEPGTVYHFRVVASSSEGMSESADVSFSTLQVGILGLPDGRGYEMVSPLANADSNVYEPHVGQRVNSFSEENTQLPFQAAADGDSMAYVGGSSATGGSGRDGNGQGNEYLATRAPSGGWSVVNIVPPTGQVVEEPVYEAFSADLSMGILDWDGREPLAAGAPAGRYNVLYARAGSDGAFHPIFSTTPPHREWYEFESYATLHNGAETSIAYAGASSNFEHVLFEANDALTPLAEQVAPAYEENDLYDSVDGRPYLVNVLPDGTPAPKGVFGSPIDESGTGEEPEEAQYDSPDFSHVISEDGTRVFWTDLHTGDLYVRENDMQPQSPLGGKGECTVSADACTALISEGGRFWTASPDGSKVLFTNNGDLYEYDVNTGQTNLVSGGEVQGVSGASEDLSYIYFVAKGALAPDAVQRECDSREAYNEYSREEPENPAYGCNLYVLHEGEPVRFIARLSGRDDEMEPLSFYAKYGDWRPGLGNRTAEVTPDGRHLVFMSVANLTGYEGDGLPEVYAYDAEGAGQLFCASCKQSGELPTGAGRGTGRYSSFLQPSYSNTYLPRWISADGTRVFFESTESLVPQDTNGQLDVYEWEQDGTGSCTEAPGESVSESADKRENGCIYLLSGGTSADNSFFADASSSGEDVFIVTRAKLVPQDEGETVEVYDARVGAPTPPVPPQCTGTGCQGVPGAPPVFATPSSVTFNGVGDFPAPATTTVKEKAKMLTRAQKLAQALKACRKRSKRRRAACETRARKRYGASTRAKKSAKGRK